MSSSVRTVEKLRTARYKQLEQSWNSNISNPNEPRRLAQMSEDIKGFIMRSMSDPIETQKAIEQSNRRRKESMDTFTTIASTLNFQHHEGTDRNMELKVIKIIMIRESLLMSLKYMAEKLLKNKTMEGSSILELLSQIRETTLNYLEALCLWRQASNQNEHPRAFLWENQNYTLKLINDMDFLSDNAVLIKELRVSPDQLRSNPLMLSNNLEDMNTWMDPHDRAVQDTQGNANGPEFESRLRLRYAERVILQEQEFYSTTDVDVFMTQQEETGIPYDRAQENVYYHNHHHNQHQQYYQQGGGDELRVGSTALEGEYDEESLGNNDMRLETYNSNAGQGSNRSYFEAERRVKTTEQYQPQSRSSTASYGFHSAPSTSQGGNRLDSGHDFFTGHWGQANNGQQNDASSFPFFEGGDDIDGSNVMYMENGQPMSLEVEEVFVDSQGHYGYVDQRQQVIVGGNSIEDDPSSVQRSVRSIDSVGDLNVKLFLNVSPVPKLAMIAASVCLILFSPGDVVPDDLSWSAFIRMCKRQSITDSMNAANPEAISKVKVLALQPILEQMMDEDALANLKDSKMSYPEYIALTKLITWVKQFTGSAFKRKSGNKNKNDEQDPKKKRKQTSPFKIRLIKDSEIQEMIKQRSKGKPPRTKLAPIRNEEKTPKDDGAGKSSKSKASKSSSSKSPNADPLEQPVSKKVIPKVATELASYHQEILEGKTKNPILLILLTTPENIEENSVRDVQNVEQSRLAVKAYDTIDLHEVIVHINMREYLLFREDLIANLHERVRDYFDPTDLKWWKTHIKEIVNIKFRSQSNELRLSVSKKAIEELLRHKLEHDNIVLSSNRVISEHEDLNSVSNEVLLSGRSSQKTTPKASAQGSKPKPEEKKSAPKESNKLSKSASNPDINKASNSKAKSTSSASKPTSSGDSKKAPIVKSLSTIPSNSSIEQSDASPVPKPTKTPSEKKNEEVPQKVQQQVYEEEKQQNAADEAGLYEEDDFDEAPKTHSKPSTAFTLQTTENTKFESEDEPYDSAYDADFEPASKPVTAAPTPANNNHSHSFSSNYDTDFEPLSKSVTAAPTPAHPNPSQSFSEVDYEEDFDQKSSILKQQSTSEPNAVSEHQSDDYHDDFAKEEHHQPANEYEEEFEKPQTKAPSPSNEYEEEFENPSGAPSTAKPEPKYVPPPLTEDTSGFFETSAGSMHVSAAMDEPESIAQNASQPLPNETENVGIANDDESSLYNVDMDSIGGKEAAKEKDDDSLFNDPDFENMEIDDAKSPNQQDQ